MAKVFYDALNNKEVYDTKGTMTMAEAKAKFSLDVSTQEVTLNDNEAQEYVGGKLEKFNMLDRAATANAVKLSDKNTAMSRVKLKLKIDDADIEDLKMTLQ